MISWIKEVLLRLTLLKLEMKTQIETTGRLQKTPTSQGARDHLHGYPSILPAMKLGSLPILLYR